MRRQRQTQEQAWWRSPGAAGIVFRLLAVAGGGTMALLLTLAAPQLLSSNGGGARGFRTANEKLAAMLGTSADCSDPASQQQQQQQKRLFWRFDEMGVKHFQIVGHVGERDATVPVILHLFLRAAQTEDRIWLQGFAFVDGVDMQPYYRSGYLLANVAELNVWRPIVTLRSITTKKQHRFRLLLKDAKRLPGRPWHLDLNLPRTEVEEEGPMFQLRIKGWPRYVTVSLPAMVGADPVHGPNLMPRAGPAEAMQYLLVLYPPQPSTTPATVIALTTHHLAYHVGIGFGAALMYLRQDELFDAVVADAGMRALVAAGQLRLVLWDNVIPAWDNKDDAVYHDQGVLYNHALLAYFKTNTFVAPLDLDEYVGLFTEGMSLADAVETCLQRPAMVNLQYVTLTFSNSCRKGENELDAWLAGITEADSDSKARGQVHPLGQYSLAKHIPVHPHEWRKSMVDPDQTCSFLVHDGFLQPEGSYKVADDRKGATKAAIQCGLGLLHLWNLWTCRDDGRDFGMRFKADTSWQWALQKAQYLTAS